MSETPMQKATEPRKPGDWVELEAEGFEEPLRIRVPKEGAVMYLMSRATGRHAKPQDMAEMVNYVVDLLDEESRERVEDRLMDFDDDYGMEDVLGLWEELLEEETARPTRSPSASTRSRATTGKNSTARASVRASTSQRSRRTGS